MPVVIQPDRLRAARNLFERLVEQWSGQPFVSFKWCPWFDGTEVDYKIRAHQNAHEALELHRWDKLVTSPGEICRRVVGAFEQAENLVLRRWGDRPYRGWSQSRGEAQRGLEALTLDVMTKAETPEEIGMLFDALCRFLRENNLGCQWPSMSYLMFLRNRYEFFPIHPGKFQAVLDFLGISQSIYGYVSWESYQVLLEVAGQLRDDLAVYEPRHIIDIQGYMYVLGHYIKEHNVSPTDVKPRAEGLAKERKRRTKNATNRERVGLAGEQVVIERERRILRQADRPDLAKKVEHVAITGTDQGYDIRSYTIAGTETHIEVKTTERTGEAEFMLSSTERRRAEADSNWCVHFVRLSGRQPSVTELGNVVTDPEWQLEPCAWHCQPKRGEVQ